MANRQATGCLRLGALGLALMVALQAPSAWGQVVADDVVCSGCVDRTDIANGTIVGTDDIAINNLGRAQIMDDAVGAEQIATGTVGSSDVLDDSLTAADLGDEE